MSSGEDPPNDRATTDWVPSPALQEARRALREGRLDDLRAALESADHALPRSESLPRLQLAGLYQAAYRFTADPELRDRGIRVASRIADRLDHPAVAVLARGVIATIHLISGRLHAVEESCEAALELAAATGVDDPRGLGLAHQFRGYVRFEWNRLPEAYDDLSRAWSVTGPEHRGIRSGVVRVMTSLAAARGRDEEAARWFERLESVVSEPMTLRNREWLAAVRIRHGLETDRDLRAIDAWRQRYDYRTHVLTELDDQEVLARLHEYEHLLTVLEATRQWEPLRSVAGRVAGASGALRPWFTARAQASRAVALEGLGRPEEADAAWAEALVTGEPEGFTRVYLEGSPARLRLLRRAAAAENSTLAAEAERILAEGDASATATGRAATLTPKQLRVLEEVARGLSNREVAEALGVAETTVKTHLRDLYRRLGVGSRTAAIAEGRRLGMLLPRPYQ